MAPRFSLFREVTAPRPWSRTRTFLYLSNDLSDGRDQLRLNCGFRDDRDSEFCGKRLDEFRVCGVKDERHVTVCQGASKAFRRSVRQPIVEYDRGELRSGPIRSEVPSKPFDGGQRIMQTAPARSKVSVTSSAIMGCRRAGLSAHFVSRTLRGLGF